MSRFKMVDVTVALSSDPRRDDLSELRDAEALMADLRREGLDDHEIASLLGLQTLAEQGVQVPAPRTRIMEPY
ncbi:hypothetical protein ASG60_21585 [Methylobacterium sp. Leaf469]|uniref:hypothetical protein n=1 Tax=Methylobacterium sp. Leaf469 TaxID=1736387 RepID=UPI0006F9660F|nr:hypothetical protein [Methylobacterium sp. Leaf469]KQT89064.1 hypothetical protein ASG60_21585 [Methylobacterium sp. Leaf469]